MTMKTPGSSLPASLFYLAAAALLIITTSGCRRGPAPETPTLPSTLSLGLPTVLTLPLPPQFEGRLAAPTVPSPDPAAPLAGLEISRVRQTADSVEITVTAWEAGTLNLMQALAVNPESQRENLPRRELQVIDMSSPNDEREQNLSPHTPTPSARSRGQLGIMLGLWLAAGGGLLWLRHWLRFWASAPVPRALVNNAHINNLIERSQTSAFTQEEGTQLFSYLLQWLQRQHGLADLGLGKALPALTKVPEANRLLTAWQDWVSAHLGRRPPPPEILEALRLAQSSSREVTSA